MKAVVISFSTSCFICSLIWSSLLVRTRSTTRSRVTSNSDSAMVGGAVIWEFTSEVLVAIGLLGWLSAVSGDRGLGLQSSRLFCSLSLSLNINNCLNLFSDNTEDSELDDLFKFLLRFWSVILHGSRHIASHFMVLSLTRKFQQKFHQTRFLFTKYPVLHILEYPYFQFLDRYFMPKASNRVDGCWFSLNQLTVGDLSWQPSLVVLRVNLDQPLDLKRHTAQHTSTEHLACSIRRYQIKKQQHLTPRILVCSFQVTGCASFLFPINSFLVGAVHRPISEPVELLLIQYIHSSMCCFFQ